MKNKKNLISFLISLVLLASIFTIVPSGISQEEDELIFKVGWQQLGAVSNLDPVLFLGTYEELAIMENVLEGLFRYDFFNNEWVPELATGMEILSTTSVKYFLRENVTFHDGTPFDADAVKWNFDRFYNITQPKLAAFHGVYYSRADKFRDYSTAEWNLDWVPPGEDFALINQTVVINDHTIRLDFNMPVDPHFENRNWGFISPTYYAGNETVAIPGYDSLVGTGPFTYEMYDPFDNNVRFEKYDGYWNESVSLVDVLIMSFLSSTALGETALLSGELDMLIEPIDIDGINDDPDLELLQYEEYPVHGHQTMIVMPVHNYNDTIRKAMSYAFDYELLINSAFNGLPARCGGVIPLSNKYYNASINLPYRNLTIARQAMVDAGFITADALTWTNEQWRNLADTSPLYVFDFMYSESDSDIAEVLISSGKDIGVDVNDTLLAPDALGSILLADLKNAPAWVLTTMGEGPDPWGLLNSFYESTQFLNFANVTDQDIDNWTWYNFVLNDTSTPSRQDIANLFTDKIQNEIYPMLWLYHPQRMAAINKKWDGFTRIRFYYFADIHLRGTEPSDFNIPGFTIEMVGSFSAVSIFILMLKWKKQKKLKIKSQT